MANDDSAIKLNDVLPAIDRKNRSWWNTLNDAQKAKFPAWLYMRYAASVEGNPDISRYYLMAVNETVNKRFNTLKNHPKLQYLLMTAASPGMGTMRHNWIAPGKKGKSNKRIKLLAKIFPNASETELEILSLINDDEEIIVHLKGLGWQDKEIKSAMKANTDD